MQTQAIEKFSMWARNKLREGVEQRAYDYALDPTAPNAEPKDATTVNGRVLSNEERAMRTELAGRIRRDGYARFVEEMAYTWFNRMVAIRFMELHDYLPSHVRVFSSAEDGAEFRPQVLAEALTVCIDGLDRDRVLACMDAADDEALFRELLLAQCNELAGFMPRVFGRVGGADALMLPANLLKPEGVPAHMVGDIPVELWDDVEILGWMYQFYNKELKDAFFASNRKAAPEDLGPATQLFTPDWIVRYMVDNSLGRLWMLNHPEGHLIERAQAENPADRFMEYYIQPDEEHEDFIRVASPEDITFCDPACGSGHILVYAFKMLMAIYEECGYRTRDIPELILTKNLSGMEIDPRAAQIATLALAMCAREHDRRFFSRNVKANICVLHDVEINADALSLTSPLRQKPELLDTLAHLGEIGSLFAPTSDDIAALEADLRESMSDDIFAAKANENVETALSLCKALNRRFDVVVANPPYMGSKNFNSFMSIWMKRHYPDSYRDLCIAFLDRNLSMIQALGYVAMITMQSWMFADSYVKLRHQLLGDETLVSLVHIGPHGFDSISGERVTTATFVLSSSCSSVAGRYYRLVDLKSENEKYKTLLREIKKESCGRTYIKSLADFSSLPDEPISYWAPDNAIAAFRLFEPLSETAIPMQGLATTDDDRFLKTWWEPNISSCSFKCNSGEEAENSDKKWFPIVKGGNFRKWYGNQEVVINWADGGHELKELIATRYGSPSKRIVNERSYYLPGVTYSSAGGDSLSFRIASNSLFAVSGPMLTMPKHLLPIAAACLNSSSFRLFAEITTPGMNTRNGVLAKLPAPITDINSGSKCGKMADECISLSKRDYDSQETSWDFKRSPLL